jgi:hypothetical protein
MLLNFNQWVPSGNCWTGLLRKAFQKVFFLSLAAYFLSGMKTCWLELFGNGRQGQGHRRDGLYTGFRLVEHLWTLFMHEIKLLGCVNHFSITSSQLQFKLEAWHWQSSLISFTLIFQGQVSSFIRTTSCSIVFWLKWALYTCTLICQGKVQPQGMSVSKSTRNKASSNISCGNAVSDEWILLCPAFF